MVPKIVLASLITPMICNQRWATATLKIAALPPSLFAEYNSGVTPLATEQK